MKKEKFLNVRNITLIGVLAAGIFVLTKFVSIPIPTPLGKTALSLGNSLCVLSAALFGPMVGGLAAGLGNALVDLSDPAWAQEFYITFINKFLMAFVAGVFMQKVKVLREEVRVWIAGLCGAVTYTVLYVAKNIILVLLHTVKEAQHDAIVTVLATKLPVSLANGVLAVICSALLYLALRKPLRRAHIMK